MFRLFQESKTIKWIFAQKEDIDFSPLYQRYSNLWKKRQKQLLIDSIFNKLDIPKLYFQFLPPNNKGKSYNYAIIDGKQRIDTIIEFINDGFPLANDFVFLDDEYEKKFKSIAGKKFSEIELETPALAARFWQYELSIVFMDTDNIDIIKEVFVRLNSGIPVNTAEKRNANGGVLAIKIQELCNTSSFFSRKIKAANSRMTHFDLALKLLMLEDGAFDLTKKSVDAYLERNKDYSSCQMAFERLKEKLAAISDVFKDRDTLLARKNIIITLYTVLPKIQVRLLRPFLEYFEDVRTSLDLQDYDENDLLKEFNLLLSQGADKKSSVIKRNKIMEYYWNKFLVQHNYNYQF